MANALSLMFVYNVNSDLTSRGIDILKGLIKPEMKACRLYLLTHYGPIVKPEWSRFIENLPVKTVFLYKNQFLSEFSGKAGMILPVILLQSEDGLVELVSPDDIGQMSKTSELIEVLMTKFGS